MVTKRCSKCGEDKVPGEFIRDNRASDGLHSQCKACALAYREAHREEKRLYNAEYRASHQEEQRAHNATYHAAHRAERLLYFADKRERDRGYFAKWRLAHRADRTAYNRAYNKANPDKMRARAHRYRSLRSNAGGTHTDVDIQRQLEQQKRRCWYCQYELGETYDVDHRVPLSRGGSNAPENLVIACPSCNRSKSDRLAHEWCGRLL